MAVIKTVVVTGASGYIGAEVVKQLLDRGYNVRAVLRTAVPEVNDAFTALASALPGTLELAYVPDILKDDAYDSVVQGAAYVVHCASPVSNGTGNIKDDQKNVVDPAVKGATNIIQSVAKYAKDTVKRIVLTSSGAALSPKGSQTSRVYNEHDWNTQDTIESSVYHYSKVQAEQAAWRLSQQYGIDLVTILPTLVLGPVILNRPNRTGLSVDCVKKVLEGEPFSSIAGLRQIDVRDTALAHIKGFEISSAKGRYILSRPNTTNLREVQHALEAEFPDIAFQQAEETEPKHTIDNSRALADLGLTLIPATTSIVDQARTLIQLGIAKPVLKAKSNA